VLSTTEWCGTNGVARNCCIWVDELLGTLLQLLLQYQDKWLLVGMKMFADTYRSAWPSSFCV